jgi:hypothetical protein
MALNVLLNRSLAMGIRSRIPISPITNEFCLTQTIDSRNSVSLEDIGASTCDDMTASDEAHIGKLWRGWYRVGMIGVVDVR